MKRVLPFPFSVGANTAIDVNADIDDMPTEGLIIEEADGSHTPVTSDEQLRPVSSAPPPATTSRVSAEWSNPSAAPPPEPGYQSEYYRQIQAELAVERSARREAEIERRRLAREERGLTYRRFEAKAGDRHYRLTLIDHDWREHMYGGRFHDGWWLAACDCGVVVRVKTIWLRQDCRRARACEACIAKGLGEKARKKQVASGGRPHCKLEGMVIGRLIVHLWEPGGGWICECATCGGYEICRNSQLVTRRGLVGCDGRCKETL